MKYLFINVNADCGSHGRIAADQCRKLEAMGHECVLAYGRDYSYSKDIKTYRISTGIEIYLHGILTRFFDIHAFGIASYFATKKFLKWIDVYNPDVIWLHNIHGYYINCDMLFKWMKRHQEKEYHWTLHDCWAFTGHCAYFTMAECTQWITGCTYCVQKKRYPKCMFLGRVEKNYREKKLAFCGIKNMKIRTPSNWLADLVKKSFLKEYPIEVVYNNIDKSVFKPTPSEFRKYYNVDNKKVILSVANIWDYRKGFADLIKLARMLNNNYAMVIVGLSKRQINSLSSLLHGMKKVNEFGSNVTVLQSLDGYMCAGSDLKSNEFKDSMAIEPGVENLYEAITCKKFDKENSRSQVFRVIIIPRTDSRQELAKIYTAADIFVNPTYEDNYPTVNLEAKACGTKVITYDIGGCRETI